MGEKILLAPIKGKKASMTCSSISRNGLEVRNEKFVKTSRDYPTFQHLIL